MLILRRSAAALMAAFALGGGVAHAAATPRIVGGSAASNPGWIGYVKLRFGGGVYTLCTAELISKSWVLTAAHCVYDDDTGLLAAPARFSVWIGRNTLSEGTSGNAQSVDNVVPNPSYSSSGSFGDIALLHLTSPDPHDPVALAGPLDPATGSVPQTLGWGLTDNSGSAQPSNQLQQVAAPVLGAGSCTAAYGAGFDAATMICAGGVPGQDSCNGDSGGPIAFQPLTAAAALLGTTDFGSDVCGDGAPAAYQRINSGANAQWLSGIVPLAQVQPADYQPLTDTTTTLSAGASGMAATAFAWDLNGDGQYGDASGSSVNLPVPAAPLTVGVRATGGVEEATRRVTLVPIDGGFSASLPATAVEGEVLPLNIDGLTDGSGQLTARVSDLGQSSTVSATLPGPAVVSLPIADDHVWHAPYTLTVALATSGKLRLRSASSMTVRITDDDKPVVRVVSSRRLSRHVLSVTAESPGKGSVTLKALKGATALGRLTFHPAAAGRRTVHLTLSDSALRRFGSRRPKLKAVWTSSDAPSVQANGSRTGPLLKR